MQICFLTFSYCFVDLLNAASPSSRYRPLSLLYSEVSFDRRYEPTNSHVSATASDLPIVTSSNNFDVLLLYVVLSLKSSDFLACMIVCFSLCVRFPYCEANVRTSYSSSDIVYKGIYFVFDYSSC